MRIVKEEEWMKLLLKLIKSIKGKYYSGVYGVPRGGIPIACAISAKLNIPLVSKPFDGCLVVDDLIDSGKTAEKYKNYEFKVLIIKKDNEWIEFWYENTEQDKEDIITRMIENIGDNPKREGLIDTPKRVTKMWQETFRGYDPKQKPQLTVFNNGIDGIVYDEMIVDTGDFYSHCEHHMVPFFGQYWFAYIPNKKILGLSKVARIVDYYSAKLQIQERLVKEILDEIEKEVKPKGIALIMRGEHLCKTMRGVKKKGQMVTSDLRGVFKTSSQTRQEFLSFVGYKNE